MELLSVLQQVEDSYPISKTYERMDKFYNELLKLSKKYGLKLATLEKKIELYNLLTETQMDNKMKKKFLQIKKKKIKVQALVLFLQYACNNTYELKQLKKMIANFGDGSKYEVYDFILNKN